MLTLNPLDVVVVDADAFIAYFDRDDAHAQQTVQILQRLAEAEVTLLYPSTVIAEATTTIQRRLRKPTIVTAIIERIRANELLIEAVDQSIIDAAATFFQPTGSKQNTLFDAIVAAVAQKHAACAIFSFDVWYQKRGFTLASELTSI
jgi:predicted nucleic acid-binding protein